MAEYLLVTAATFTILWALPLLAIPVPPPSRGDLWPESKKLTDLLPL